jgi:hypothetical protein
VSRRAWLPALGVILAAALVLRLVFFVGLTGWDDLEYREASARLFAGDPVPHSLFGLRWGLTLPLGIVQALGGHGEHATALVPLAYSLAGIVLTFALGRWLAGERAGLAAAAVLALVPLDALAASDLHADLPASVFLALAAYLALRAGASSRARTWLALAGACVAVATLTKESSLAFVLVLLVWGIRRRWSPAAGTSVALGFIVVVAVDTAWLRVATGAWLYRLSPAITAPHAAHMRMIAPSHAWMADYVAMLLDPRAGHFAELGGVFYLVVLATVAALAVRAVMLSDVVVWWGTLLAALSLAPLDASFTRPMFVHFARTAQPLLTPFALTIGLGLAAWRGGRLVPAAFAGGFAVLCAAGLWATHFDGRQWAAVARQAAPVIERAADVPVMTDAITAALLRSLLSERRAPAVTTAVVSGAAPALVLRDPLFIASALQHERPVAAAVLSPPAEAERVAVFERRQRPRLRAWLGQAGSRSPTTDAATLWRVGGAATAVRTAEASR